MLNVENANSDHSTVYFTVTAAVYTEFLSKIYELSERAMLRNQYLSNRDRYSAAAICKEEL